MGPRESNWEECCRAESRGVTIALEEPSRGCSLCYLEPGAGVGSNEIRPINLIGSIIDQVSPYRRDDMG
jgi:hypothetical protein